MTRTLGIGLFVTLAALAAVFFLRYEGATPKVPELPVEAARGAAAVESGVDLVDQGIDTLPATALARETAHELEADAAQIARIRLTVLLYGDDSPVAGAKVDARVTAGDRWETLSGITDGTGRVTLETPAPARLRTLTVAATEATAAGSFNEREWLSPGDAPERTLRVTRGGTLLGRVVDASGTPVAGAAVRGWCGSFHPDLEPDRVATSDGDGAFTVGHLGVYFALDAVADGMACVQGLRGELAPGEIAKGGLEIVMRPAASFPGRVVDPEGEPVAGVSIVVEEHGTRRSTDSTGVGRVDWFRPIRLRVHSATDGSFVLGPLPKRERPTGWRVVATQAGFLSWRGKTPAAGEPLVIRLEAGESLRGVVLGPGSAPVGGAKVRFRPGSLATTGEDGAFTLKALALGKKGYVTVEAAGLAPLVQEGLEVLPPPTPNLVLRLEPGLDITGVVLDGDGTPLEGAEVRVEGERTFDRGYSSVGEPDTWEWAIGRGRTFTGPDGAFRLADLNAGTFQMTVHPADAPSTSHDLSVDAGTEDLVVRFDRAASERVVLTGRVFDRRTREPVTKFKVTPMVHDDVGSATGTNLTVEAADGTFRLTGFDPGRIGVNVAAAGYAKWQGEVREYELGEHDHRVLLSELRSVELRLVTTAGDPAPGGWRATFATPAGRAIWPETAGGGSTSGLQLQRGAVKAVGLPGEPIRITFSEAERDEPLTFDVDLGVDRRDVIDFVVDVEEVQPDVELRVMVCGATTGVELPSAIREPASEEWINALKAFEDAWFIDTAVHLLGTTATDRPIVMATLSLEGETYASEWERPGTGQGASSSGSPYPAISVGIPSRVQTLRVGAEGYREQSFDLDRTAENLGVPRFLFLRRQ